MTVAYKGCWVMLVCCLGFQVPQAGAHHGPTKVIEALSDRLASGERSAELLARRGDEYRSLGDLKAAATDYESALALDPNWAPALYGLARVHIAREQLPAAQAAAERAIELAANDDAAAPFHALLACIHGQSERWEEALQSWESALASSRPDVDWYLGQAQLLWKLNRAEAAERALRSATEKNPSEVLKRAWYESLIRCGQLDGAQQPIEAGLESARWKSSWLLLRARLHASRGHHLEARQDAHSALAEIDQRLQPDAPNPFLTADKAQALALLGRSEEARRQAATARSLGVPAWKLEGYDLSLPFRD